ncbi:MAG: L-histidine N(alpha)-methyltransferase [Oscillatoria sp. SIO1A7]|nr:L-histidine N(alpha)-methyltransferase [Oscillatoria sp. SIO1A7]
MSQVKDKSNVVETEERLQIVRLASDRQKRQSTKANAGRDVAIGLSKTPKSLPPQYFYDDRGSELFEQICSLPEYYPTRTEAEILRQYAGEIAGIIGKCELVELGSGSSTKTRLLLEAFLDGGHSLLYVPVDVSGKILEESARKLGADYPSLQVRGLVGTYEEALTQMQPSPWPSRTVVFLGSSLGNFAPEQCDRFFEQMTTVLEPGDYFLLGIDLQKPKDIMEAAYNDSQGTTAEFNLNMLAHLNWRFGGNFDLSLFYHQAIYNESKSRIEMHLHCKQTHTVYLESLDFKVEFSKGESILTEISRKFNVETMQQYLEARGLKLVRAFTDPQQWFGLLLCQV